MEADGPLYRNAVQQPPLHDALLHPALTALVLKVLYVRKRIFCIDHLVYALHIHAASLISRSC